MLPILFTFHFSLLTISCGPDKGTFRMEGEFKGFNQGEFYVYSTDGGIRKLDTIGVKGGRFTYQRPLDSTATFVLVFPNYSEIPVIGASGTSVDIKGDASHLKEIEVKGTKENELMTGFRLKVSEMMPPETVKEAADFIMKHPASLSSIYLLNKYYIQTPTPDYKKALELAKAIQQAKPDHERINTLVKHLEGMQAISNNGILPKFTGTDIKGKPISNGDLLDRDSITWCNICDERMWDNPILTKLGLSKVPDNIITNSQGKILAHSLPVTELNKKINELLK